MSLSNYQIVLAQVIQARKSGLLTPSHGSVVNSRERKQEKKNERGKKNCGASIHLHTNTYLYPHQLQNLY